MNDTIAAIQAEIGAAQKKLAKLNQDVEIIAPRSLSDPASIADLHDTYLAIEDTKGYIRALNVALGLIRNPKLIAELDY